MLLILLIYLHIYDNDKQPILQTVEIHMRAVKIFFKNVDIMSTSYLTFAPEKGFFPTLAPITV